MSNPQPLSSAPYIEAIPTVYKPKNLIIPLRKASDELFLRELIDGILEEGIACTDAEVSILQHIRKLLIFC